MKTKKVNRIDKAVVIVVAMVAMMVLSCAISGIAAADRGPISRCPSGDTGSNTGGDTGARSASSTLVEYEQTTTGVGYEDIHTYTSTGYGFSGIGTSIYSRGTGSIVSRRNIMADTTGQSSLSQEYEYTYSPVNSPLGNLDQLFRGKTGVKSYPTGTIVSDKYSQTYTREGAGEFTGDNTRTEYSADAQTFGQTNFRARVVDIGNYHHTVMRSSEEQIGDFATSRSIRTVVTPRTINP